MLRVLIVAALVAVAGCQTDDPSTSPADGRGGGDSSGGDPSLGDTQSGDTSSGDGLAGDDNGTGIPQLILDLRAGVRDAEATLRFGAEHDGWPRLVAGGYLFVRLQDGGGPYRLAGDHEGWSGAAMQLETGLYWIVVAIPSPTDSKYKFVDGGTTFAADPWARRYIYDSFGEVSLVRAAAAHLERFHDIGTAQLLARTVRVWVPAGTVTHQIYVHDGQNLFNPDAMWGGWQLQNSLGATTMAIGIDNTADRIDEYTHVADDLGGTVGGNGDAYSDFVRDVVRPMIEAEYGTAPVIGVMGSSLGGLIAYHEVLRDPTAWHFAAALSGTFGWGSMGANNETLIERYAAAGLLGVSLYLDSGGNDGGGCIDSDADGIEDDSPGSDNCCVTSQLAATLAAAGWQYDTDLWHWWEPDAPHNEAAWAARVWRALAAFEAL